MLTLPNRVAVALLFALAYGAAARIGLAYSSVAPNVTLLWAPTGISLFVVLRWGPRTWPGIVLGDLIGNAGTGATLAAVAGISLGNVAQTLVCAWALSRTGFRADLGRVRDVVALAVLGSAAAAASAAIGPAALALSGSFAWSGYASVAAQWWMGDATGVVVLAPLLLAWWTGNRSGAAGAPLSGLRRLEAAALLAAIGVLCALIFGGVIGESATAARAGYYPAALAFFPLAMWAALRFGLRGATLATLLFSIAAVWGTVRGVGPFVDAVSSASLARWWVFANVITLTSLLLAAAQSERDRARAEAIRDRDFSDAVLDAEGALVVVLDAAWRIERVNRALEVLTGFGSAELVGRAFTESLIPMEQHSPFDAHAELLRLRLSANARQDAPLRRRARPPVVVSWTMTALHDANGRIGHVIVSGVDVSYRVDAAASLRDARRLLERRVAERTSDLATANADLQTQIDERRRLEQTLIDAGEHAQQRFGQELHDGLGQHLTATALRAELLAGDLAAAGADEAARLALQVEAMVSEAIAQTRGLARGLYPVEIEGGGLMAALAQLAESTALLSRRTCIFVCPEPVDIAAHATAVQLYRIAQEAVRNAVKHGTGSAIEIVLVRGASHGGAELRIGNAVDTRTASARLRGLGLHIMRHRASVIGAAIEVGLVGEGAWQLRVSIDP